MKKLLLGLMLIILSLGFVGCGKDLSIPKNFEGKYETIEKGTYDNQYKIKYKDLRNTIFIKKIGKNQYKVKAEWYSGELRELYLEQTFEIIGTKKDREKDPTHISYEIKELGKGKFIKENQGTVGNEKNLDWNVGYIKVSISPKYATDETEIFVTYGEYVDSDYFSAKKKGIEL